MTEAETNLMAATSRKRLNGVKREREPGDDFEEDVSSLSTETLAIGNKRNETRRPEGLKFHTIREIAARVPDPVESDAFPLFWPGLVLELTGPAKLGGKTTLIHHALRAMFTSVPFLGRATRKAPVIYLTEESEASFRRSLNRTGLLALLDGPLYVVYLSEHLHLTLGEVVAEVLLLAKKIGARSLVCDTAPAWARMKGEEENQSGPVLECVAQFRRLSDAGLAVILVRHDRKMGGEIGQSGRGSSAWAGAVDILANLKRAKGAATYRRLALLGRVDDLPESLLLNLTADGYDIAPEEGDGSTPIVPTHETVYRVLAKEDQPHESVQAVTAKCHGVSESQVRRSLKALFEAGRVDRVKAATRGAPELYRRSSPSLSFHSKDKGMDMEGNKQ